MSHAASFQSENVLIWDYRQSSRLSELVRARQGVPIVVPILRQVNSPDAHVIDTACRLMTGQFDMAIFVTEEGVRQFLSQSARHADRTRIASALADIVTVARGPKTVVALKEAGIEPRLITASPHTWREVLAKLDAYGNLLNHTVLLQELGQKQTSLIAGIEARGGTVVPLQLYHWEPAPMRDVEDGLQTLLDGKSRIVLWTSAHEVRAAVNVAEQFGRLKEFRAMCDSCVMASIGLHTSAALSEANFLVDLQASLPTIETLIDEAAQRATTLLATKSVPGSAATILSISVKDKKHTGQIDEAKKTGMADQNCLFLRACRNEPVERTPIWLMRQAGRYLPEYRRIREKRSFLEFCKSPELSAEVMLITVERLGVDAAIIFSDLLPILEPLGFNLEFTIGEGPVLHNPVRVAADLKRIRELDDPDELGFVYETVRLTRAGLRPSIPVIGFAGAPFTLASYAIEGGGSRSYIETKRLMYSDPGAWNALLDLLTRAIVKYLDRQIAAGAQCVQLFDSWVGCLGPADYERFVLPHLGRLLMSLDSTVPVIYFGTGNPALLPSYAKTKAQVIGLDWRIGFEAGRRLLGDHRPVQGNLDPAVLMADRPEIERQAQSILDQNAGRPGHIFNLGHGVFPNTPVENVIHLIRYIQEHSGNN